MAWSLPSDERLPAVLGQWSNSDREARRWLIPQWVAEYDIAIDQVAEALLLYQNVGDLVRSYLTEELNLQWIRKTVCVLPGGRRLRPGVVLRAAYWRRCQQLFGDLLD